MSEINHCSCDNIKNVISIKLIKLYKIVLSAYIDFPLIIKTEMKN